jgi:polysaccharide biosynthesis protein PslG
MCRPIGKVMPTPLALILALVLSSCSTLQLGKAPVEIGEDAFGLAHGGSAAADYPFLESMGARWVRHTFKWDQINPGPGTWRFEAFDSLMGLADANGAKVIAVLAYDVGWIHPGGTATRNVTPDLLPLYLDYVREVVGRYRGRVDAWEIWNEPNVTFWKGSRKDFYRLAAEAAKLVKELDPGTPLLAGATFRTDSGFIAGLRDAGAFAYADALSIHPYAVSPTGVSRQIAAAKEILLGLPPGKELWITEIGFPTRGLYPSRVSLGRFPEYVIKTLALATSQGVRVTVWFKNFDARTYDSSHPVLDSWPYFGLAYNDRSVKEGGKAFAAFAGRVKGGTYDPAIVAMDEALSGSLCCAPYVEASKEAALVVLWSKGALGRQVRVHSPGSTVRVLYPVPGIAGEPAEEWRGTVGEAPVILELNPLDGRVLIDP